MNDPYVGYLRYSLKASKALSFEDPPPLERETSALKLRLEDAVLTVWPKEDLAPRKRPGKLSSLIYVRGRPMWLSNVSGIQRCALS